MLSRTLMTATTLLAATAAAQPTVSDREAAAIAQEAYIYFYPLVTMDITRRQSTNMEAGKEMGKGPMNMFINMPEYPPADFKVVVRPNFDTLYSSAWLDLTKEPVVVTSPDTHGRYFMLPMLDMWSDVFACPGTRTTGDGAANYLVTGPGWTGTVPPGMERIAAPTPYVWIIGRTRTDGPKDYEAVHAIQAGYKVTPFSRWGKPAEAPAPFTPDQSVDMNTPPKTQVDTMSGERYFTYAMDLLRKHPPHITDQPIIDRMRRIGLVAGKPLEYSKLQPALQSALAEAPKTSQNLMAWKMPSLARVVNGWVMNTDTMGVYGTYYLKRAIVAQVGLGANLPEDAVYPMNLGDSHGKPLHGDNTYVVRFKKGELPPVNGFWSITMYDSEGFQVPNPINRFAVSSWMPFKTNADDSLDLYIQNAPPAGFESNWLPAPKGPFNILFRLYGPQSDILTGKWNPPPVEMVKGN